MAPPKGINDTADEDRDGQEEELGDGEYVDIVEDDDKKKGKDAKGAKGAEEDGDDTAAGGDEDTAAGGGSQDRLSVEEQDRRKHRESARDRRARQREARDRTQRQLHDLQTQLNDATARIEQLTRHGSAVDAFNVDQQIRTAEEAKRRAEASLAHAINAKDANAIATAMANRDAAADHHRRMTAIKERLPKGDDRRQPQRQQQQQQQRPDPRIARQFDAWRGRNDWFDPEDVNEDTRIAMALDQAVEADGFDPTTKEYWDELEDRCRERLPHLYEEDGAGADRTARRGQNGKGQRQQRRMPPNGGAGGRNGGGQNGNRVFISAERVQAMKDAGVWDDPEARKRYIKSFRNWDKDNADLIRSGRR